MMAIDLDKDDIAMMDAWRIHIATMSSDDVAMLLISKLAFLVSTLEDDVKSEISRRYDDY
jgi:hypothetical protein